MHVSELLSLVPRTGAIADILVAWLATYAVHSTALILIAIVATSRRAPWRPTTATRDVIWKSAIIGGLFTASLQLAVDAAPLGGTWKLRPAATAGATNVRVIVTSGNVRQLTSVGHPLPRATMPLAGRPAIALPLSTGGATPGFPIALFAGFSVASMYIVLAALLWLTGVVAMLWRHDGARMRLDRILGDRTAAEGGIAGGVLKEAMRRAGVTRSVRLTTSAGLESPAVVDSDEICVPRRFFSDVNILEQESILAHELAHVMRRDTWWLRIANFVVYAFFFQPLNRVARDRLIEVAEFSADEWAVQVTGAPLHLARGLAAVASWLSPATRITALPAMASGHGSVLVRRVIQLTTWPDVRPAHGRRGTIALALATLLGAAAAAPRIDLTNPWSGAGVRRMVFQERIDKGDGISATQLRVFDFEVNEDKTPQPAGGAEHVADVIIRRAADHVPPEARGVFVPRVVTVYRFASTATSD